MQMGESSMVLLGDTGEKLPRWFAQYDWRVKIDYKSSSFIKGGTGIEDYIVQILILSYLEKYGHCWNVFIFLKMNRTSLSAMNY